jgi:predicted DsbA family dithiol-disulfide isomerase
VKLDILSDPICPWCLIGKTHLDAARAADATSLFDVEWHPYQLNPDMPPGGMDRRAYLESKFGGRAAAVRAYAPVVEAAAAAGLEIDWAAIERTPNTLDSHRLIHWAGLEGYQDAAVSALFAAYFVDGRDIGDTAVLADIAESCGMDRDVVARLLSGDGDRAAIAARDAHARARGVTGVPTFIAGDRHVLRGAQPPDVWAAVIADLVDDPTHATA